MFSISNEFLSTWSSNDIFIFDTYFIKGNSGNYTRTAKDLIKYSIERRMASPN